MKRTLSVLALAVSGCLQDPASGPAGSGGLPPGIGPGGAPAGRELGTLTAIYPVPLPDGSFDLELRMTLDTIWVDLDSLQAFASDSAGKALIRSTVETFYTRDEKCFFNPKKEACLEFKQVPMEM